MYFIIIGIMLLIAGIAMLNAADNSIDYDQLLEVAGGICIILFFVTITCVTIAFACKPGSERQLLARHQMALQYSIAIQENQYPTAEERSQALNRVLEFNRHLVLLKSRNESNWQGIFIPNIVEELQPIDPTLLNPAYPRQRMEISIDP